MRQNLSQYRDLAIENEKRVLRRDFYVVCIPLVIVVVASFASTAIPSSAFVGSGECRAHVAVSMDKEQEKWWFSKGQAEFPGICVTPYLSQAQFAIRQDLTPVRLVNPYGRVVGGYVDVDLTLHKLEGGTIVDSPMLVSYHQGMWRWSKPAKDAFRDAIDVIALSLDLKGRSKQEEVLQTVQLLADKKSHFRDFAERTVAQLAANSQGCEMLRAALQGQDEKLWTAANEAIQTNHSAVTVPGHQACVLVP